MSTAPLGGPFEALRERRCTLGITVSEDFRDARIELEALSTVSVVPVVAATHALAARSENKEPLGTAELADHLQIVLEDPTRCPPDGSSACWLPGHGA